eukprot:TRINITY_DN6653_c0_g1_i2.p1 TRINITY_DN6653_c0_g1~~TRINITY_DN6653_c0_g1_i2.p1  ORF type:complete len:328 (-),score=76.62 TRINITY_DN6653_c0_g1_i2:70-1053(-)
MAAPRFATATAVRGYSSSAQPKTQFMGSAQRVGEYFVGASLGLAAGYYVWGDKALQRDIAVKQNSSSASDDPVHFVQQPKPAVPAPTDPLVLRVVLTGGPCGGKTSAMSTLTKTFKAQGYSVYVVPEIPTLLFQSGIPPISEMKEEQLMTLEEQILRTQLCFENTVLSVARAMNKPAVVFFDRGLLDVGSYLPLEKWHKLLDSTKWVESDLRSRYDLVVHLVTAADGAEKHYTSENNNTRTEGVQMARELDQKVRDAWVAHPNVAVIDNSTDFQNKVTRAAQAVTELARLKSAPATPATTTPTTPTTPTPTPTAPSTTTTTTTTTNH